jgi:hypothetical protein
VPGTKLPGFTTVKVNVVGVEVAVPDVKLAFSHGAGGLIEMAYGMFSAAELME